MGGALGEARRRTDGALPKRVVEVMDGIARVLESSHVMSTAFRLVPRPTAVRFEPISLAPSPRLSVLPCPRRPFAPLPQHLALPSSSSTHE